jgi:hypothetical protein
MAEHLIDFVQRVKDIESHLRRTKVLSARILLANGTIGRLRALRMLRDARQQANWARDLRHKLLTQEVATAGRQS